MLHERQKIGPSSRLAIPLAVVYFLTNVASAYAVEANFWSERRRATEKLKSRPSLAEALPALEAGAAKSGRLSSEQHQLLAQLPRAAQLDFGVSENRPLSTAVSQRTRPVRAQAPAASKAGSPGSEDWLSQLILPFGSLREVHLSPAPGAPFIIHIQDAHGIEEAQKNMAAMIQRLRAARGLNLVGLEGAAGGFDLAPYRDFPDPAVTKDIADYFLKEGYLGGPEHAALTAESPPLLWGAEDLSLYESNIQAFRDSLKNKPAVHEALTGLDRRAAALKEKIYSPSLKEFDRRYAAYKSRREGLAPYVRHLMSQPVSAGGYPNLRLLVNALDWEDSLDFKAVEKERLRLVETLAENLSQEQLADLVRQSLQYRLGQMTYGGYHRYLRGLCRAGGVALENFGPLNSYINYVLLAERINRNELLMELAELERFAQDALALRPDQKRLVAAARSLLLLEKLTGHNMTPPDWLYYETNREKILHVAEDMALLEGSSSAVIARSAATKQSQASSRSLTPDRPLLTPALLKPFEEFCLYAVRRNNALVDNLLAKMKADKTSSAVLVAGGFHTDGLTQVLRRQNASYVVVTPKITEVPKDHNYLDVFARDPLPLEKLFSGEKIYLVRPPALASSTPGVSAGAFAVSTRERTALFRGLQLVLQAMVKGPFEFLSGYKVQALPEDAAAQRDVLAGLRNPKVVRIGERSAVFFKASPALAGRLIERAASLGASLRESGPRVRRWFADRLWWEAAAGAAVGAALQAFQAPWAAVPALAAAAGLLHFFLNREADFRAAARSGQAAGRASWMARYLLSAVLSSALIFSAYMLAGRLSLAALEQAGPVSPFLAPSLLGLAGLLTGATYLTQAGYDRLQFARLARGLPRAPMLLVRPRPWADENVPELADAKIFSRSMESIFNRTLIKILQQEYGFDLLRYLSQSNMTGGLGHVIYDYHESLGLDGADVATILPLWDRIKGKVRHPEKADGRTVMAEGLPPLPEGYRSLGEMLRDVMPRAEGIRLPVFRLPDETEFKDWAASRGEANARNAVGRDIHTDVYVLEAQYSGRPEYYLDAYYLDGRGRRVYIFDEPYADPADGAWRPVQVAVYSRASQFLMEELMRRDPGKQKLVLLNHEVFTQLPDDRLAELEEQGVLHDLASQGLLPGEYDPGTGLFKMVISHDFNHTVYLPGVYKLPKPARWIAGLGGRRDLLVRDPATGNEVVSITGYRNERTDALTGVAEIHRRVLRRLFAEHGNKIRWRFSADGAPNSTNGVLLEHWQGEEIRYLINAAKKALRPGADPGGFSDEEFYAELDKPENAARREEFKRRFELIKAYYVLELLMFLRNTQGQEMGGARWLEETLAKVPGPGKFGLENIEIHRHQFHRLLLGALEEGQQENWDALEAGFSGLADALLQNPIASNVRRQVSYKGPDLYRRMLKWFRIRRAEDLEGGDEQVREMLEIFENFEGLQKEDYQAFVRAREDFLKSGTRLLIGGRMFGKDHVDLFEELKARAKELGLEPAMAFLENYNSTDAEKIFRAASAVVMLSDEFMEAAASSPQKGAVNGARDVTVYDGAGPEVMAVELLDGPDGAVVEVKRAIELEYDELVRRLDDRTARMTGNSRLIRFSREPSGEAGGGRRPSLQSLFEHLTELGRDYRSGEGRRAGFYDSLRYSYSLDVKRQTRAFLLIEQDAVRARQDRDALLARILRESPVESDGGPLARQIEAFLYGRGSGGFAWRAGEKILEPTGPGWFSFWGGVRRVKARFTVRNAKGNVLDEPGRRSLLRHSQGPESAFRHMAAMLEGQPALRPLLERVEEFEERARAAENEDERLQVLLDALDFVQRMSSHLDTVLRAARRVEGRKAAAAFLGGRPNGGLDLTGLLEMPGTEFDWRYNNGAELVERGPPGLRGLLESIRAAGEKSWGRDSFAHHLDHNDFILHAKHILSLGGAPSGFLGDLERRMNEARAIRDAAARVKKTRMIHEEFMRFLEGVVEGLESRTVQSLDAVAELLSKQGQTLSSVEADRLARGLSTLSPRAAWERFGPAGARTWASLLVALGGTRHLSQARKLKDWDADPPARELADGSRADFYEDLAALARQSRQILSRGELLVHHSGALDVLSFSRASGGESLHAAFHVGVPSQVPPAVRVFLGDPGRLRAMGLRPDRLHFNVDALTGRVLPLRSASDLKDRMYGVSAASRWPEDGLALRIPPDTGSLFLHFQEKDVVRNPVHQIYLKGQTAELKGPGKVQVGTLQKTVNEYFDDLEAIGADVYALGALEHSVYYTDYTDHSERTVVHAEDGKTVFAVRGRDRAQVRSQRDDVKQGSVFAAMSPTEVNPRVAGSLEDLAAAAQRVRRWGGRFYVDFVPNHLGLASPQVRTWLERAEPARWWDAGAPDASQWSDRQTIQGYVDRGDVKGLADYMAQAHPGHFVFDTRGDGIRIMPYLEVIYRPLTAAEMAVESDAELLAREDSQRYFLYYTRPGDKSSRILVAHGSEGRGRDEAWWQDTVQLNYLSDGLRRYMIDALKFWADRGISVRADMAHLALRPWFKARYYNGMPQEQFDKLMPRDFWAEAMEEIYADPARRDFVVLAEVYADQAKEYLRDAGLVTYEKENTLDKLVGKDRNDNLQDRFRDFIRWVRSTPPAALRGLLPTFVNHDDPIDLSDTVLFDMIQNWKGQGQDPREIMQAVLTALAAMPNGFLVNVRPLRGRTHRKITMEEAVLPGDPPEDKAAWSSYIRRGGWRKALRPFVAGGSYHALPSENGSVLAQAWERDGEVIVVMTNLSWSDQKADFRLPRELAGLFQLGHDYRAVDLYNEDRPYDFRANQLRRSGLSAVLSPFESRVLRFSRTPERATPLVPPVGLRRPARFAQTPPWYQDNRVHGIEIIPVSWLRRPVRDPGVGKLTDLVPYFREELLPSGQDIALLQPLNPTDGSPYPLTAHAIDEIYVDWERVEGVPAEALEAHRRLLEGLGPADTVDFRAVREREREVGMAALRSFRETSEFRVFRTENAYWLDSYAAFRALSEILGKSPLDASEADVSRAYADPAFPERAVFHRYVQWVAREQLKAALGEARSLGVKVLFDLPFFRAYRGAEQWARSDLFQEGHPGVHDMDLRQDVHWRDLALYDWSRVRDDAYSLFTDPVDDFMGLGFAGFRWDAAHMALPGLPNVRQSGDEPGVELLRAVHAVAEKHGALAIAETLGAPQASVEAVRKEGFFIIDDLLWADADLPRLDRPGVVVQLGSHDEERLPGRFYSNNFPVHPQDILRVFQRALRTKARFILSVAGDLHGDTLRINARNQASPENWRGRRLLPPAGRLAVTPAPTSGYPSDRAKFDAGYPQHQFKEQLKSAIELANGDAERLADSRRRGLERARVLLQEHPLPPAAARALDLPGTRFGWNVEGYPFRPGRPGLRGLLQDYYSIVDSDLTRHFSFSDFLKHTRTVFQAAGLPRPVWKPFRTVLEEQENLIAEVNRKPGMAAEDRAWARLVVQEEFIGFLEGLVEELEAINVRGQEPSQAPGADILGPLVRPLERFGTWRARAAYYLSVGAWESAAFQAVGLGLLPSLLGPAGLLLGIIWTGPPFLFAHALVRWLVKAKKDGIGWREARFWKGLAGEFLGEFRLRNSRLWAALAFNAVFLSAPLLNLPSLLAVTLFHSAWDAAEALRASRQAPSPRPDVVIPEQLLNAKTLGLLMEVNGGSETENVLAYANNILKGLGMDFLVKSDPVSREIAGSVSETFKEIIRGKRGIDFYKDMDPLLNEAFKGLLRHRGTSFVDVRNAMDRFLSTFPHQGGAVLDFLVMNQVVPDELPVLEVSLGDPDKALRFLLESGYIPEHALDPESRASAEWAYIADGFFEKTGLPRDRSAMMALLQNQLKEVEGGRLYLPARPGIRLQRFPFLTRTNLGALKSRGWIVSTNAPYGLKRLRLVRREGGLEPGSEPGGPEAARRRVDAALREAVSGKPVAWDAILPREDLTPGQWAERFAGPWAEARLEEVVGDGALVQGLKGPLRELPAGEAADLIQAGLQKALVYQGGRRLEESAAKLGDNPLSVVAVRRVLEGDGTSRLLQLQGSGQLVFMTDDVAGFGEKIKNAGFRREGNAWRRGEEGLRVYVARAGGAFAGDRFSLAEAHKILAGLGLDAPGIPFTSTNLFVEDGLVVDVDEPGLPESSPLRRAVVIFINRLLQALPLKLHGLKEIEKTARYLAQQA
jgi:4-alpha-glucanotransferase